MDPETADKILRPILPARDAESRRNFRHLTLGRLRAWWFCGMSSRRGPPVYRSQENFDSVFAARARTKMSRHRSQDRHAMARRDRKLREDLAVRRMTPGSFRSRNKAEPLRGDSTSQRLEIDQGSSLNRSLFWHCEPDEEHCRREDNVEPGVGRIVRHHAEQHSVGIHEPENRDDGVNESEDFEPQTSRASS